MIEYWIAVSVLLSFGLVIMLWKHVKHRREISTLKETIGHLTLCCEAFEKTQQALQAALDRATKLANAHIAKNEDFEKERNTAWELYRKSSLQAGRILANKGYLLSIRGEFGIPVTTIYISIRRGGGQLTLVAGL